MTEDFNVNVMFPDEYRDFIAEICFEDECVCTVTQEGGPTVFSLECEKSSRAVPLAGFLEALEHAQKRLQDLQERRDEE